MADTEPDTSDPRQVASFTFAYLRRLDQKLNLLLETQLRHDTRLGRVERDIGELKRDIGELKSDMVLLENRLLTQANEVLTVVRRIDEHQRQLDAATAQP